MSRPSLLFSLLLGSTLACEPGWVKDLPTEPVPDAQVAGTWIYTVSELRGPGHICSIQNLRISFNQSENLVSGTTSGGTLQCLGPEGGQFSEALGQMTIVDGLVATSLIRFGFGDDTWIHVGQVAGNQIIGGSTEWTRTDLDVAPVRLQGQFQAVKQ